jgi:outer membrane protein insertion porin family
MSGRARLRRLIVLAVVFVGLGRGAAPAQVTRKPPKPPSIVERVEVSQNQYLKTETLLYYVSTKAGDRFDESRLKDDFRRLWETGFLQDLQLDVKDGKTGKIVTFVVQERKRIQIVDYRGAKSISASNIEDELRRKDAALRVDSFYDPAKARKVESVIKEMLLEKGRPFATVTHEMKPVGTAGSQVSFVIDEGPKARVKKIDFAGNQAFSDGALRAQMRKVKPRSFWNLGWLTGKGTYSAEKWAQDQERLREHYLNHGYVTATIGEPKVSYVDGKAGFFKRRPVKWVRLEIPVTEGEQYRVGEMSFEGLTVFKEEDVRPLFKLGSGDVYEEERLKKGYEKLRALYGTNGYFQWTPLTRRTPDPARKVVDLTLSMDEDKKYYVGRILFTGNDTTRDKVIRREVSMNEGDVFDTEALKHSIRRINQLGYFKPMDGVPELHPSELGQDRIDVTFKVQEQNRTQFTFGGGVSGLEGAFLNATFQTANFLGLGETFQASAQNGKRTKNYQLALTEPYLFDRPITAGIDVFKRKITYESFGTVVGFTQASTGASLVAGLPLGRFTRMFANYSYEIIDIANVEAPTSTSATPGSTTPIFDPFLFGEEGRRRESRVGPSIVLNTVDNPWTPRSGVKLLGGAQFAGGPLGGTVNYVKPTAEAVFYVPNTRKTALGLRAETAWIVPFGDTRKLPYYNRFFLGGETQIRGYNIRSVGPVDDRNLALGGNKYVLFNAEYYFDIGGPLRFVLFFDAGQSYLEGKKMDLKGLRTSTGAELRFLMPVLNVPFRLIYAVNPHRDAFQPRSTFKFAVGTTF